MPAEVVWKPARKNRNAFDTISTLDNPESKRHTKTVMWYNHYMTKIINRIRVSVDGHRIWIACLLSTPILNLKKHRGGSQRPSTRSRSVNTTQDSSFKDCIDGFRQY